MLQDRWVQQDLPDLRVCKAHRVSPVLRALPVLRVLRVLRVQQASRDLRALPVQLVQLV